MLFFNLLLHQVRSIRSNKVNYSQLSSIKVKWDRLVGRLVRRFIGSFIGWCHLCYWWRNGQKRASYRSVFLSVSLKNYLVFVKQAIFKIKVKIIQGWRNCLFKVNSYTICSSSLSLSSSSSLGRGRSCADSRVSSTPICSRRKLVLDDRLENVRRPRESPWRRRQIYRSFAFRSFSLFKKYGLVFTSDPG